LHRLELVEIRQKRTWRHFTFHGARPPLAS
jgi:hypothetical protein